MAKLKNTFFFCTQDYHVLFAKKIINYGFKPFGFLENRNNKKTLNYNFPNIKVLNYHNFLKSNLDFENSYKYSTPPEVLRIMNNYFYEYSKILLRQDTFFPTIKLSNALKLFNLNIYYWYNLFKENKIELNVFEEEPHKSNVFLVYQLSLVMKIQTYMPLRTIGNLGILPISNYLEKNQDFRLKKLLKSKKTNKTNKDLLNYISNLSKDYNSALKLHLWNQIEDITKNKKTNHFFKVFKKDYYFHLINYSSDFKTYFSKLENSKQNYANYLINKIYKYIYINRLKNNYSAISKKLKLHKIKNQYIYFPLQMQPEKSTLPLAGPFEDSAYTIDFVLKNTPKNYKILIKEHPTHFISWRNTTNLMWRDLNFYRNINNLSSRVIFVNMKTDVFDLIDNSLFVASVGGTACWEAAVREKRSINFSNIWFDNCHGISTIKYEKDIIEFITQKKFNEKIDKKKVINFAKRIIDLGYLCAHGNPLELENLNISASRNAEILKNAFIEYFDLSDKK